MKKHVVVVDDDAVFGDILCSGLSKSGFTANKFESAQLFCDYLATLAEQGASARTVDIFIVDYHLDTPDITGLDLCRKIKAQGQYPVIMLTGVDDVDTTVACLYAGAEQYVTKPYSLDELVARIHVVLKGWARAAVANDLETSGEQRLSLLLKGKSRLLCYGEMTARLTQREVSLAECLLGGEGLELEREHIYFAIFGRAMEPFSRAVDILVARLRKKLKLVTEDYVIIPTRNSGYMLVKK